MPDPIDDDNSDAERINMDEPHEVRYWSQRLGVSEQALRQAAADVGRSLDKIAEHLGRF